MQSIDIEKRTQTRPEEIFWLVKRWLDEHTNKVPYMLCNSFKSRKDKADFIHMLRRLGCKRDKEGSLRLKYLFTDVNSLAYQQSKGRYGHEFYAHAGCDKTNRKKCFSRNTPACIVTGLYRGYL